MVQNNMSLQDYQEIQISTKSGYVQVTLNRPKVLNALNVQVLGEFGHFFSDGFQAVEEAFSAVVIMGSGSKAFAAGADIAEFNGFNSSE